MQWCRNVNFKVSIPPNYKQKRISSNASSCVSQKKNPKKQNKQINKQTKKNTHTQIILRQNQICKCITDPGCRLAYIIIFVVITISIRTVTKNVFFISVT